MDSEYIFQLTEFSPACRVPKYSLLVGEDGGAEDADDAGAAVDGDGVERVVQPELDHGDVDGEVDAAAQRAHHRRRPRLVIVAAGALQASSSLTPYADSESFIVIVAKIGTVLMKWIDTCSR